MAFDFSKPKEDILKEMMNPGKEETVNPVENEISNQIKIPYNQNISEKKERYNITLEPSVRKHADILADKYHYPSASSFINDLLKQLD
ncbi:hypothetical protein [Carnobacterium maltaromaticum]|uniref:hypothetical protein n=1 Tax=Carnobacterium maltaromaticum TaxID=2751 RepID=UPI00054ED45F|nr:hypothetical protein [Carnobacterium maltaromaticum]KRN70233.1 hypothetical protein IV70_GL000019 [Carnobacterium maltaromaticum DSM 20342]